MQKKKKQKIWARDNFTCRYCHKDLIEFPNELSVDHVFPLSKGGTDNDNNLVTSCKECNAQKNSKTSGRWKSIINAEIAKNGSLLT